MTLSLGFRQRQKVLEMRSALKGDTKGARTYRHMLTTMDDTLTRAAWIDRFVMHTRALGVRADPELIKDMAAALWPTLGHMQPEAAAQEEYDQWRPQDF